MPIEIEYKFVIKYEGDDIIKKIMKECDSHSISKIKQVYLKGKGRVREYSYPYTKSGQPEKSFYEFNYKEQLVDGGNFEIEKEISKDDYDIALTVSTSSFVKNRLTFKTKSHKWEVDFFMNEHDNVYFVLMECEVDDGIKPNIDELPEFIKNSIVYSVDLDDNDFTSKKLGNVEYAEDLYNKVLSI